MKNKLLIFSLFFVSVGVFAQLTVKPNGAIDSYLYVKNQVLYVEGEVNLTQNNPAGNRVASIYLRDGGQLIQGGNSSTNSGNGFLSVQQKTDPTNSWAYYHWAPPVGNSEDLGGASGNINFGVGSLYEALPGPGLITPEEGTIARKVATTPDRNGYTDPQLTVSTRWLYTRMIPLTEQEDAYDRINSDNAVPAGFGFTMKGVNQGIQPTVDRNGVVSNHEQLYEFRGRPNSGTFEIPVQEPDGSEIRMTLSGNPYPSALDLNRVYYDSENSDLIAFYYYDEDRTVGSHFYSDVPYGFATWVPGPPNPDGTPGEFGYESGLYVAAAFNIRDKFGGIQGGGTNLNLKTATRIAPIGQGIMFGGSSATPTNIKIKNEHRRFIKEGLYSIYHRPNGTTTSDNSEFNDTSSHQFSFGRNNMLSQLRLYVAFNQELTRDLLLGFSNEATDGFDRGYDAPSPMGMASDAYIPIVRDNEVRPHVISTTNYQVDKRIPISIIMEEQGRVDIIVAEEINRVYSEIYLYDTHNHTQRNLDYSISNSQNSDYRGTTLFLPAGEHHDRFYIVFEQQILSPKRNNDIKDFKNSVNVYQNNPEHQLEIHNPSRYNIKSLALYDMTGKLVLLKKNLGNNHIHSFYTGNLSDGVYIVKLLTADDMSVDYKTIVRNK